VSARCIACLIILGLLGPTPPLRAADRPNVVVIMADDLGWGSIGCYGANPDLVRTPHIDRLAREGRRFTDANTTSSVCSPTRYSLLTGRYCWRTSLQSEVLGVTAPLHIEPGRVTIASLLKAQGYHTAAVGKWHLGYGSADRCDFTRELKPGPLEIGFDYHFGVPANHGDLSGVYVEDHWVYELDRTSPSAPSPPYVTHGDRKGRQTRTIDLNAPKRIDDEVMATLTDKAVAWIDGQKTGTPFFLYFTPVAVHNPITPSARTAGGSKGGPFCDFLHDLDDSVGRVLDALDRRGFAGNTLILFTSDNGGVSKANGDTPQNQARDAGLAPTGPFRGGKHDVWEGGFRVPYLVRWPGRVPAGTVCEDTVSVVDTLASLASLTGAALPEPSVAAEDSHDVAAGWLGRSHAVPLRPDLIVHSSDGNFAIRRAGWKWIEGVPAGDLMQPARKARAEQFQPMLFHVAEDVAEAHEASAANPDRVNELKALLERYRSGGYSRQMPPVVEKPKPVVTSLAPLTGRRLADMPLDAMPRLPWITTGGPWALRDGAISVKAGDNGASLAGLLGITDGAVKVQARR
jgi:arylsulfatase A-like enzyme